MAPPCINYMQYPWGYTMPMRICITHESYHQYPWVISSVPMRVCSTCESYPQYPWVISLVSWGYAVPVSHILSTCESYPQYPWRLRICSTRESYPQYPWLYAVPMREILFILHSYKFTHGYCISSRVLRIWLRSFLYVKLICLKMTEKWPQVQAVVSYMYVS